MGDKNKTATFLADVLPAELEEIESRRKNGTNENTTAPHTENRLTTTNNLTGLACSGGGIRSASFSLGVIQHIIAHNLFNKIDYLSTVSGGGYIGACISALTKDHSDNAKLLTDRVHQGEPEALNHIRNYSEYLRANGFLSSIRLPVLFIEGTLRSVLIFLPLVILATFITELFFEITGTVSTDTQWYIPLIGVLPLISSLILRPILKDRQGWLGRDRADARLVIYSSIALISLIAMPLLAVLREMVHHDASTLLTAIQNGLDAHPISVAVGGGLLLVLVLVGSFKMRTKFILITASVVAPALLLTLYVFFCVQAINSPYSYGVSSEESSAKDVPENKESPTLIALLENMQTVKDVNIDCALTLKKMEVNQLCRALEETFLQKHLILDNYLVTSLSRHSVHLSHRFPSPTFQLNEITAWLALYLTTNSSRKIDISLTHEFGKSVPMIQIAQLRLLGGHAEWWLYLLGVIVQIYNGIFININRFSLHPFYRDRLSRTFLICPSGNRLATADTLKMSELNGVKSQAPYHIINTALNLQGSVDPQLRSRKTIPFILSKRYCGSDYTGYCKTLEMEAADPHLDLGAAMAISAAAASPNMGTGTIKALSFLLTLLNVRLNYWLPNPGKLQSAFWKRSFRFGSLGLPYLIREALGLVSERAPYLNCSDGGHFENLAMYELLRRQCKTIICIDAEADPDFTFGGLVTLQRYAEIDLGIKIDLDVSTIKPANDLSSSNFSEGIIHYSNGDVGRLLYLKLAFTGSEPEYLHYYRGKNPAYPHQATSDQYFDETQFEVYRALGNHIAASAAKNIATLLT